MDKPSKPQQTEIITKAEVKKLNRVVDNETALVELSVDPPGLQIFLDKQKKGKLKYHIDLVKCINLYMKGISIADIAKTQGLNSENRKVRTWLSLTIKKYKPNIDSNKLAIYKEFRTEYLQEKQRELLEGITDSKIREAGLKDIAFAYDKLFVNERLNEDKSTGNVAHQFSSLVEKIHQRREESE